MKEGSCVILCTGGIGSGKSVVARVFHELGLPVYDCDRAAKELYDRDPQLLSDMVSLCGETVLDADGRLDKAALSRRIFGNAALLAAVEDLVHPAVIRDFENWKQQQESALVLIESAILLEKPRFAGMMDYTVVVTSLEAVRIRRVMARDGVTEEQVRKRMAAQWSDAERMAKADFILENDDRQALLPAVLQIIETIKQRWKRQI
jgi:dephospho-CoA kinase